MDITNRSKMISLLKSNHATLPDKTTPILHTPVGSYYGQGILEGFADDAEYLGKLNTGKPHFDHGFYRLCKLDNL